MSSAHLAEELRAGLTADDLVARAGVLASANDLLPATALVVPGARAVQAGAQPAARATDRAVRLRARRSGRSILRERRPTAAADVVRDALRDGVARRARARPSRSSRDHGHRRRTASRGGSHDPPRRSRPPGAPAAIGPYSQGIVADGLLFCAGQAALDPATGALVEGGIEPETERVMANLTAVLDAAGCTWGDVVKTTIFLVDMADFAAVNAIYGRFVAGSAAGPLDGRRRRAAEGRPGRDRGRRPARLTPPTSHPYDAPTH